MKRAIPLIVSFLSAVLSLGAQDSNFNVALLLNTSSAEQTIAVYEGLGGRPEDIALLRGSRLALATTALLAQQELHSPALVAGLEAVKFNQSIQNDVFRLREARQNVAAIKELLDAIQRRNFSQKVVSTVEQLFPPGARVNATLPVYLVAFGHSNIDAYVRRVVWRGDNPVFVGEGEGELTIVVNLAKAVSYGRSVDERFLGLMSVVAHEVFHAAFGAYKDGSPGWRRYYAAHGSYLDQLLDIAHNEGIAYYLTLIQRSQGRLRNDWVENVQTAFSAFNKSAAELMSTRITPQRANDILRLSNTSTYWESYGAITGMIVARQIDQTLGREALVETVERGPVDFFQKYVSLMNRDTNLPPLAPFLVRHLNASR
jgi:hypothetical protein